MQTNTTYNSDTRYCRLYCFRCDTPEEDKAVYITHCDVNQSTKTAAGNLLHISQRDYADKLRLGRSPSCVQVFLSTRKVEWFPIRGADRIERRAVKRVREEYERRAAAQGYKIIPHGVPAFSNKRKEDTEPTREMWKL